MTYDLLIIGGGINGAAIAREAALNGLRLLLVEKDDLASHTSSASTKLIHGGLRYLEYYEFRLVREALKERERLLRTAPHLIKPMLFILPHENAVRPWWLVRLGLWLYDTIGGRISLPRSRGLRQDDRLFRAPLKAAKRGFVYSDAWVDDSRLVVLNAMDAARNGAEVRTRTGLIGARREGALWHADLTDGSTVSARAIINAAGPWVGQLLAKAGINSMASVRLIKGSHIIVERLFEGEHAYMLQQPDRRIVFAIPYHGNRTLIGTTDVPVDKPEDAKITAAEIDYLCAAANRYFRQQISPADIVTTYSGVRPLYDDGASDAKAITRDYVLEIDANQPPLLSVFGGKITTARHLAEEAVAKLGRASGWQIAPRTREAALPGGNFASLDGLIEALDIRYPFVGRERLDRMTRAYGTLLNLMLEGKTSMGQEFGAGLSQAEVDWLIDEEWAQSADDIVWRRTKLGLQMTNEEVARLEAYVGHRLGSPKGANPTRGRME